MNPRHAGFIAAGGIGLIVLVDVAIHLGAAITPTPVAYPWNPFDLFNTLATTRTWPAAATPLVIIVALAAITASVVLLVRTLPQTTSVDRKQHLLLRGNNIRSSLLAARTQEAARLHPHAADLPPGQRVGVLVGRETDVFQGWRDTCVALCGPGRGKTSSLVIPKILRAPGAAMFTSRRIDGVQEILAGRGEETCWVFDPQRIYRKNGRPDFVFDLLAGIRTRDDADELAEIFETATKPKGAKTDAQFDPQGKNLLAFALLAAARTNKTLRQVHEWLNEENGGEQIQTILEHSGDPGAAVAMAGLEDQYERTRKSVYATAQRMAAALSNDEAMAWTTTVGVRRLDPEQFVRSKDTLVLLSKKGTAASSAFLTALVRAVCKAAEQAAEDNGGRLQTPFVVELDECANVVKWPDLPDLYSYYGGYGIALSSYFQSWAQGEKEFGAEAMRTMWNAAGIRIYGGGESAQDGFLRRLSDGIGDYDEQVKSYSAGTGNRSTSTSTQRRPIMSTDDLERLPFWRAIVSLPGARPVLIETKPWFRDKTLTARVGDIRPAVRTDEESAPHVHTV
jgi:type IV secretory pathway TraG/TraD family ATPase VirD4